MTKRVWLLGLLLVMAQGSGVVADDATPVPLPWYAPDDIASQIPRQVGDLSLTVREFDAVEGIMGRWQGLLIPLGKEPNDVRAAIGESLYRDLKPEDANFHMFALRIDGVPAAAWAEPYVYGVIMGLESEDLLVAWGYLMEWQEHDGRRLLMVSQTDGEATGWSFLYPKGEVLFMVSNFMEDPTELSIEDVLAELP